VSKLTGFFKLREETADEAWRSVEWSDNCELLSTELSCRMLFSTLYLDGDFLFCIILGRTADGNDPRPSAFTPGLGARYADGIVYWENKFTPGSLLMKRAVCSVEIRLPPKFARFCSSSCCAALSLEGERDLDIDAAIGVLENFWRVDLGGSFAHWLAVSSVMSTSRRYDALFPGPEGGTDEANVVGLSLRDTELKICGKMSTCLRSDLVDLEDDPVLA
jgi:hypothetical protein